MSEWILSSICDRTGGSFDLTKNHLRYIGTSLILCFSMDLRTAEREASVRRLVAVKILYGYEV